MRTKILNWQRLAQKVMRGLQVFVDILVSPRSQFERLAQVYAFLEAQVLDEGKLLYEREPGKAETGTAMVDQSST